ncbi:MAG: hypothetical protein AOA66_0753 [Candidatus Bathyarchaeota archaeon BA2]|nr:MAG: hypothetical protein AOA66_0753 [Candidatus Bathyarchaeota archaeon BA2]
MDTGAGKTLIPERDAAKLGLEYVGDTEIITGSGKDHIKLYKATITFLNKEFSVLVLGRGLPEQAIIKAIVGRDILDKYKVCFDRIQKEIERYYEIKLDPANNRLTVRKNSTFSQALTRKTKFD